MALGIGEILGIGASILGRSSASAKSGMTAAEAKLAYDFEDYKMTIAKPEQAVPVKFVQSSAQYSEFLQAWDNFLNNDYAEMAKRIIG